MAGITRYRDVFTFRTLEVFGNWRQAHNQTWAQARDCSRHLNSIFYSCIVGVFRHFFIFDIRLLKFFVVFFSFKRLDRVLIGKT